MDEFENLNETDEYGVRVDLNWPVVDTRLRCYNAVDYNPATRNPSRNFGGFAYRPDAKAIREHMDDLWKRADSNEAHMAALESLAQGVQGVLADTHTVRDPCWCVT